MAKKEKQPQQAAKEMAGGAEQAGRARVLHNGVYASVITAAAIALAIVVCLVMEALPRTYTEFDLSETGIYTLSDTTKEILGGLEQDVTLYYLAQTGNEDPFITGLLDRYAEHSGRVTWQQKDPALNPTFAGQYDAETASEGSVIVVSGEESNLIDYYDFYPDYYYYSYGYSDTNRFDGENCLTTAIYNVTSGESSRAYYTTNHGETTLGSGLLSAIEKQNISLNALSLLTSAIPEDCELLIINCPQQDFTDEESGLDELSQLKAYLAGGGKLILCTDYSYETPNLDALMAEYGLSRVPGVVLEGDANYHSYTSISGLVGQACLLPQLEYSEENGVTADLDTGVQCLLPLAHGIARAGEMPAHITAEPLLTTSSAAYSKIIEDTLEKEEGDAEGPFPLAIWALDSDTNAEVIWIGSGALSSDTLDAIVNGSNSKFLLACAAALTNQSSETLVDAKALESETLVFSAGTMTVTGLVFPLLLPLALVAAGVVVVILRRRR